MTGMISIDGSGDQRLEAGGDEDDDPDTLEAGRAERGRKSCGENFQIFAREYI